MSLGDGQVLVELLLKGILHLDAIEIVEAKVLEKCCFGDLSITDIDLCFDQIVSQYNDYLYLFMSLKLVGAAAIGSEVDRLGQHIADLRATV